MYSHSDTQCHGLLWGCPLQGITALGTRSGHAGRVLDRMWHGFGGFREAHLERICNPGDKTHAADAADDSVDP